MPTPLPSIAGLTLVKAFLPEGMDASNGRLDAWVSSDGADTLSPQASENKMYVVGDTAVAPFRTGANAGYTLLGGITLPNTIKVGGSAGTTAGFTIAIIGNLGTSGDNDASAPRGSGILAKLGRVIDGNDSVQWRVDFAGASSGGLRPSVLDWRTTAGGLTRQENAALGRVWGGPGSKQLLAASIDPASRTSTLSIGSVTAALSVALNGDTTLPVNPTLELFNDAFGSVSAVLIFQGFLDATRRAALLDWLYNESGIGKLAPRTPTRALVTITDSNGVGFGTDGEPWQGQIDLPDDTIVLPIGQSSMALTNVVANFAQSTTIDLPSGTTRLNAITTLMGLYPSVTEWIFAKQLITNDVQLGNPANAFTTQIVSDAAAATATLRTRMGLIRSTVQAALGAGESARLVAFTVPRRPTYAQSAGANQTAVENFRQAWNATGIIGTEDWFVVDIAAGLDPTANASRYQADALHYNNAGHSHIAGVVQAALFEPSAPSLLSSSLAADGVTWTLSFSEPVLAPDAGGWSIDAGDGVTRTATVASGSGTAALTLTVSVAATSGDELVGAYNADDGTVTDLAGNALASVASFPITNASAVAPLQTSEFGINLLADTRVSFQLPRAAAALTAEFYDIQTDATVLAVDLADLTRTGSGPYTYTIDSGVVPASRLGFRILSGEDAAGLPIRGSRVRTLVLAGALGASIGVRPPSRTLSGGA